MTTMKEQTLNLRINGQDTAVSCDYTDSLVDVLRENLGLTGTKIGCRTGECGACTIIVDGKPVVSCLLPAASAQGHDILSIEYLSQKEDFGRLVKAMVETGGVQCGFCTPGIMVTLWAFLQNPERFGGDIGLALKNNLCRCTGYQSIFAAVEKVIAAEGVRVDETAKITE